VLRFGSSYVGMFSAGGSHCQIARKTPTTTVGKIKPETVDQPLARGETGRSVG